MRGDVVEIIDNKIGGSRCRRTA
jgi:hypothetical protein